MAAVDLEFMAQALDSARLARDEGEVPVGAVVVQAGRIVGRGHNATIRGSDPTAHAEIVALRDAARRVGNHRLEGAIVYCTVEPCLMCLGALFHARIARLVFGATDTRWGGTTRLDLLRLAGAGFNHQFDIEGGVEGPAAAALLLDFFRQRRAAARSTLDSPHGSGEVPKWS